MPDVPSIPSAEFTRGPADEHGRFDVDWRRLAERLGVLLVRDESATRAWVEQALAENAKAVADARTNPRKRQAAAGFLRGQVMKISGGKADGKLVGRLLEELLATE